MKTCLLVILMICLILPAGMGADSPLAPAEETALADAYFDDAVFVGDSVLKQLARYRLEQQQRGRPLLGEARFLSVAKYTLYAASLKGKSKKVRLRFQGRDVTLVEGLRLMEAGKVFVMLGLNDHAGNRLEVDIARYGRTIDNVREALPGITFVALSITPVARSGQSKTLTQQNLDAFNQALEALCREKGVAFLNLAPHLKDSRGYLNLDYSNDNWVHLNDKGLQTVVDALRSFAREQQAQAAFQGQEDGRP